MSKPELEQLAARAPVRYRGLYLRALRGELAPRRSRSSATSAVAGAARWRIGPDWRLRRAQLPAVAAAIPKGPGIKPGLRGRGFRRGTGDPSSPRRSRAYGRARGIRAMYRFRVHVKTTLFVYT